MADARLLDTNEDQKQRMANQDGTLGKFGRIIRPLLAEYIGTTMHLLTGLLTLTHAHDIGITSAAFGISLAAYVACFGHISGGHFNPATTVAVFFAGDVHLLLALVYIVVQLTGGITAAALARLLFIPVGNVESDDLIIRDSSFNLYNGINHLQTTWWKALIAEMIFTSTFTFVVLMTTKDRLSKTGLAPFLVGLTMSACILAMTVVSGGHMNPARSFGSAVITNSWSHHYVFWAGPLCGAVIAAIFYRFIFSHNRSRLMRPKSTTPTSHA